MEADAVEAVSEGIMLRSVGISGGRMRSKNGSEVERDTTPTSPLNPYSPKVAFDGRISAIRPTEDGASWVSEADGVSKAGPSGVGQTMVEA
jgi:hypothetical protein